VRWGTRRTGRVLEGRYAPRTLSAFPRHVQAAGGVILRDGKVCVIHRPDYEDWSLPKGKLDGSETHEDAALREVHEETGLRCRLGAELSPQDYVDRKGRPKTVRWWAMGVLADEGLTPSHEVDERRWIPVELAETFLTYEHDRELVREALTARERW
jgi:8-oxo-dGTP pyrophosphatase MutT (NUDIX family)